MLNPGTNFPFELKADSAALHRAILGLCIAPSKAAIRYIPRHHGEVLTAVDLAARQPRSEQQAFQIAASFQPKP